MLAGQGHSLFEGRLVDHQAGAGQDALAVGVDDGLVDGGGVAEVVRVDDEAPLAGTSRLWPTVRHGARQSGSGD